MKKNHGLVYLVQFAIIGLGFAFLLSAPLTFFMQLLTLVVILMLYIFIGLLHHNSHHDIGGKVVLEYILIGALIVALYIFLNISKI